MKTLDHISLYSWPEMPDPTPSISPRPVYGVQDRRPEPDLLPHQHRGAPGPSEGYKHQRRYRAEQWRRIANERLAERCRINGYE